MYSRPLKLFAPPQPLAHGVTQFRHWRIDVLAGFTFFLSFFVLFSYVFKGPNR
jgi:hypothetical protein